MILDASELGLHCFASPLGSKFPRRMHFLYGLRLREMPCFKRFRDLAGIKEEKSFSYSQVFIGNLESMPYVESVASNKATIQ